MMSDDNNLETESYDERETQTPAAEQGGVDGERGIPAVGKQPSGDGDKKKWMSIGIVGVGGVFLLAMALMPHHQKPKGDADTDPAAAQSDQANDTVGNRLPDLRLQDVAAKHPADKPDKPPVPAKLQRVDTNQSSPNAEANERAAAARSAKARQRQAKRYHAPILAYGGGSAAGGSQTDNSGGGANGENAGGGLAKQIKLLKNYLPGGGGDSGAAAGLLGGGHSGGGGLSGQLSPTKTPMAHASLLPDRNFLITKGTFVDCILETSIDSDIAGFTSCRVAHNVYSDNGRVLLLERGSRITGEYKAQQIKPGMNRIFVLWDRVETPNGVIVDLNSPSIGPLGRAGAKGAVDSHWFKRFGSALLLSLIDDYVQYKTAQQQSQQQLQLTGTANETSKLAGIALKNNINIKPTLYKNQGDHIKVYVARDISFADVYGIQKATPAIRTVADKTTP